jgi:hypothetical protein
VKSVAGSRQSCPGRCLYQVIPGPFASARLDRVRKLSRLQPDRPVAAARRPPVPIRQASRSAEASFGCGVEASCPERDMASMTSR